MRAFSLLVCFASWLLLSPFELQPIHALLSSRPLHLLRRNGRNKLSSTTQKLRMLGRAEAVRVIVIGRGNDIFEIETSYVSSRTGTRGSFTTSRTWEELEALDSVLLSSFGRRVVPNLPPRASHAKYIDAYLNSLLADGIVLQNPEVYEFLDAPPEAVEQPIPVEVLDAEWKEADNVRRTGPDRRESTEKSAAVAGAVIGGIVGGPLGAVLGGLGASAASKRSDSFGEVARGAGKLADDVATAGKDIDKEYHITEKLVQTTKKIDDEFQVSSTAKKAVRGLANVLKNVARKF